MAAVMKPSPTQVKTKLTKTTLKDEYLVIKYIKPL